MFQVADSAASHLESQRELLIAAKPSGAQSHIRRRLGGPSELGPPTGGEEDGKVVGDIRTMSTDKQPEPFTEVEEGLSKNKN